MPSGIFRATDKIHQGAGAFAGDDLEMIGLAANDAAQRDHALVGRAGLFGGVEQDRGGGGDFQRAGRARNTVQRACAFQRLGRALQQHFADERRKNALRRSRKCAPSTDSAVSGARLGSAIGPSCVRGRVNRTSASRATLMLARSREPASARQVLFG